MLVHVIYSDVLWGKQMAETKLHAARSQLFTNVRIFDGTGSLPEPGEVLVEGNRIKSVAAGGH